MITQTDRLAFICCICYVCVLVYTLDVHRKMIIRGKPDTEVAGGIIVFAKECIASPSVKVSCCI